MNETKDTPKLDAIMPSSVDTPHTNEASDGYRRSLRAHGPEADALLREIAVRVRRLAQLEGLHVIDAPAETNIIHVYGEGRDQQGAQQMSLVVLVQVRDPKRAPKG